MDESGPMKVFHLNPFWLGSRHLIVAARDADAAMRMADSRSYRPDELGAATNRPNECIILAWTPMLESR
jgi:hypothetical protein